MSQNFRPFTDFSNESDNEYGEDYTYEQQSSKLEDSDSSSEEEYSDESQDSNSDEEYGDETKKPSSKSVYTYFKYVFTMFNTILIIFEDWKFY